MRWIRVLIVLALLAWATEAHTSEHHDIVSLEVVARRASAVVVAVPASPAERIIEEDITPPGNAPDREKWPPYVRRLSRWTVTEVLFAKGEAPSGTIEVDQADLEMRRDVHERYYVEGVNKIPIYETYEPSAPKKGAKDDGRRILFLSGFPGSWSFVVADSVELPARKAAIVKLLKARQKR